MKIWEKNLKKLGIQVCLNDIIMDSNKKGLLEFGNQEKCRILKTYSKECNKVVHLAPAIQHQY
jgi:hypothetical protein